MKLIVSDENEKKVMEKYLGLIKGIKTATFNKKWKSIQDDQLEDFSTKFIEKVMNKFQDVEISMGGDVNDVITLSNWHLHYPNLQNANFSRLKLDSLNFENADLTGANFEGAELMNVRFNGALLKNVNFKNTIVGSNFSNAIFEDAEFDFKMIRTNTSFRGAKYLNMGKRNYFAGAVADFDKNIHTLNDYEKNDLQFAFLMDEDLKNYDLKDADLEEAILIKADLQGADLREANLKGANLQAADLENANLQNANLQKAKMWLVNLQKANLQKANLQKATFKDNNLKFTNLMGANCEAIDFQEVIIYKTTNLSYANLSNCKFKNVKDSLKIDGANLNNSSFGVPYSISNYESSNIVQKLLTAEWENITIENKKFQRSDFANPKILNKYFGSLA